MSSDWRSLLLLYKAKTLIHKELNIKCLAKVLKDSARNDRKQYFLKFYPVCPKNDAFPQLILSSYKIQQYKYVAT
jgi:hypothetical protein